MDQILHFLCPKEKGCSPFKTTFAAHAVSGAWEVIATDCMGPLLAANLGNRYILIIDNLFTKYIETAASPSIETTIITQVFLNKMAHLTDS